MNSLNIYKSYWYWTKKKPQQILVTWRLNFGWKLLPLGYVKGHSDVITFIAFLKILFRRKKNKWNATIFISRNIKIRLVISFFLFGIQKKIIRLPPKIVNFILKSMIITTGYLKTPSTCKSKLHRRFEHFQLWHDPHVSALRSLSCLFESSLWAKETHEVYPLLFCWL